jgi:transcriptional regulator with XRE-family HTH domain
MKQSIILTKFGKRIKQERLERNLSQEDFAELIGFHRTYVGMIERDERNLTLINIEKIASALDMEINELLDFNATKEAPHHD